MTFRKAGNTYCIRIHRGEELVESFTRFLKKQGVTAGHVSGIGAVRETVLGYFDEEEKAYRKKTVPEPCEVLNLAGNVAMVEGEPFAHLHILLGKDDYSVIGGHLFNAIVTVTCEIYLTALNTVIEREVDLHSGLKLLNL